MARCKHVEVSMTEFIPLLFLNEQQRRALVDFSEETLNFIKFWIRRSSACSMFHVADELLQFYQDRPDIIATLECGLGRGQYSAAKVQIYNQNRNTFHQVLYNVS